MKKLDELLSILNPSNVKSFYTGSKEAALMEKGLNNHQILYFKQKEHNPNLPMTRFYFRNEDFEKIDGIEQKIHTGQNRHEYVGQQQGTKHWWFFVILFIIVFILIIFKY